MTPLTNEILHTLGVLTQAQAVLHELHNRLHLPGVVDEQKRTQEAEAYEQTVGILRRRADKQTEGSEERVETERRARWFEERAKIKRANLPMPRELRTELEGHSIVARIRADVARLLEWTCEVDEVDLPAFVEALLSELDHEHEIGLTVASFELDPSPMGQTTVEAFREFRAAAAHLLAHLGAYTNERGELKWAAFGIVPVAEVVEPTPAPTNGASQ